MALGVNQVQVMELLKDGKWASTQSIHKQMKISYRNLLQALHRMKRKGLLKARYGQSRGLEWQLVPPLKSESGEDIWSTGPQAARPTDLISALSVFARGHKLPKFIETGAYKAYAQAIGGLYKHAVDVCYGAAPSPSEIGFYRKDLQLYAQQLQDHLKGVQAILNADKLWNYETSSEFLLSIPVVPELTELRELSDNAIRENQ